MISSYSKRHISDTESRENTWLSFIVKDELFAVSVLKTFEVLQKRRIARIPNAPEHVKGIINYRGEIIPVFEIRTKFGLPTRDTTEKRVIIVLQVKSGDDTITLGVLVDIVKNVINIPYFEIKPVPSMSKNFNPEFLEGIVNVDNDYIMLLNVDKVFSHNELDPIMEINSELKK